MGAHSYPASQNAFRGQLSAFIPSLSSPSEGPTALLSIWRCFEMLVQTLFLTENNSAAFHALVPWSETRDKAAEI